MWQSLTEYGVAQHLVFMWGLSHKGVGDGAGRVGEAGQVGSCCQGI